MFTGFSKEIVEIFIDRAGKELAGDWVLLGGSLSLLLGITSRVTHDIDIVGPKDARQSDTLKLMQIALDLALPVESINQAAAFFLFKVSNWQNQIVLIHKGAHARIFRPNATLFIQLKIARMSESDSEDILGMIAFAAAEDESIDTPHLISLIEQLAHATENTAIVQRLEHVRKALL